MLMNHAYALVSFLAQPKGEQPVIARKNRISGLSKSINNVLKRRGYALMLAIMHSFSMTRQRITAALALIWLLPQWTLGQVHPPGYYVGETESKIHT